MLTCVALASQATSSELSREPMIQGGLESDIGDASEKMGVRNQDEWVAPTCCEQGRVTGTHPIHVWYREVHDDSVEDHRDRLAKGDLALCELPETDDEETTLEERRVFELRLRLSMCTACGHAWSGRKGTADAGAWFVRAAEAWAVGDGV
eukprot:CAMPEP_0195649380 /NCGR_PEP_ID=MMETSP0815-20121206/31156_1 /TAXON_ID=97485 /ORGANISM="Prymnesium parvum, Strain Texoma1" /LENGTH=149 /DNA_ID=CAMNT_0040793121 /DNA_START=242 /DNA_END=690 /DNA_ORIENTATION=+